MDSLSWEPEKGSRILILPRQSKSEAFIEIPVGCGHCLHLINCFEENGTMAVDILELECPVYPEYQPIPELYRSVSYGRPTRYRIDLSSGKLVERICLDYSLGADFPAMDTRLAGAPYDDFWMLGISATGRKGRKFFDQLVHGSWRRLAVTDIFCTQPGHYLAGECVYVPHPREEGQGMVIVQHLDAAEDRAEMLLFDAYRIAGRPLARLPLRHKIHPGFHASFRDKTPGELTW